MITIKMYDEAKDIIAQYEQQKKDEETERMKKLAAANEERYRLCGDHEYRSDVYKWGSPTRVRCISCGHTKE